MMSTDFKALTQPDLPYTFEFEPGDYRGIADCLERHGFAIARAFIPLDLALELRDAIFNAVVVDGWLDDRKDITFHGLFEICPALWKLFDTEHYLPFARHMLGEELTVLRSAAIIRAPGSNGMCWHSDTPVKASHTSDALNMNTRSFSGTMYLTGMHPDDSGLALIPDSHRPDWPGPEGFELSDDRKYFYRRGESETGRRPCTGMDVPGVFAPITAPNDRVFFHRYLFHAVFPHRGTQPRISSGGCSFRPREPRLEVDWPLSDRARRFIASAPAPYADLVADYVGYPPELVREAG